MGIQPACALQVRRATSPTGIQSRTAQSTDVRFDPRLQVSAPHELFKAPREWSSFDVAEDGRLLVVEYVEPQAAAPVTIVLNWTELLKEQ